ncbi:hypothetical protein Gotri_023070, partial [Gossypium trilobum]|nr:hypothetical protein [Gossypium trilobum]
MDYQIPAELKAAFISTIDKGNIRTMPNRSMHVAPHPTPGALLMGSSKAPVLSTRCIRSLRISGIVLHLEEVASTINTLAGALYKVFSASPDPARKEMRQACFDYWSFGGIFSNGPISLLSGLNPPPISLVLHFFVVAIYGVG